ncbi:MAG: hypothetical protein ACR2MP_15605, partial [Streptosporangiaceae bacterium]
MFPDQGAVTNNAYVAKLKAALGSVGVDLIGQEFAPASATDFNSVIQRVVSKGSFDLLFASDANFIKQYRLAGYQQPQFASHITQSDI